MNTPTHNVAITALSGLLVKLVCMK